MYDSFRNDPNNQQLNNVYPRVPTIAGEKVDLFGLYYSVVNSRGFHKIVCNSPLLAAFGTRMGLHGTEETLSYQLRIYYFIYLFEFEKKYQILTLKQMKTPKTEKWNIVTGMCQLCFVFGDF